MVPHAWVEAFAGAVTVCDRDGVILEMNERAAEVFREQGGRALVGTNVLECHPEPSRSTLREMLRAPRRNVYTIEKRGQRKLIYQAPWYADGAYQGYVELSLDLPADLPHFVRQP